MAHIDGSATEPAQAHLSKVLTLQKLRTGFHACIVTQASKVVSKFIANCTHCKKIKASVENSDKWILRMATEANGIFHSINMDILGPFRYKLARLTRNTQVSNIWVLQATSQLSSAISFTLMEKYDTESFLAALETHSSKTRYPTHLTTDSRSQIKCGLKRLTRYQMAEWQCWCHWGYGWRG